MKISSVHAPERVLIIVLFSLAGGCALRADLGVMTHFAQGWDPSLIQILQADGITHVRDELYWSEVEKTRGNFVFPSRYRDYMAGLAKAKISPLVPLTFANPLYDEGRTPHSVEALQAYARYAVEVLDEFSDQIDAVEIWNEFNGSFCDGPAAEDRASSYGQLLASAAQEIRKKHPRVTIVGGVTAGVPFPYLERLFAGGALANMDAVSVHPYRYDQAPEGIEAEMERLAALIERYAEGKRKPIWVTEIGWTTDLGINASQQGDYLARAFALLRSAGVERIYWYLFRDYDQFATMGLRRDDAAATAKPALQAFRQVSHWLNGAVFVSREASKPEVYSLRFRDDAGEFRVLWSLTPALVELDARCTAEDVAGGALPSGQLALSGSPVYVRGEVRGLPSTEHRGRLLADSRRDFSLKQGANGWSYGYQAGESFRELAEHRETDWAIEWAGPHFVVVRDDGQHPGSVGAQPVEAVRRWTSPYAGKARLIGRFSCGVQGDGVTVRITVDNEEVYLVRLGEDRRVDAQWEATTNLNAGSVVAIRIGPGEEGNVDFDYTRVAVSIEAVEPP